MTRGGIEMLRRQRTWTLASLGPACEVCRGTRRVRARLLITTPPVHADVACPHCTGPKAPILHLTHHTGGAA